MSINTLLEMCELIVDCPHSTPKWTDSGFTVLRNQAIKKGSLNLKDCSFTDELNFNARIKRAAPKSGDIVITREAPMGEVCKIPDNLICCLGQRQVLLRPKHDVDADYLLYVLQSKKVQEQILWNEGTGSTVSNLRIPVLERLEIPRFGRFEKTIGEILKSLDDKIHLNNQINKTLESIAQAIFKSWFIDFEPVRAKIAAKQEGKDPELAAMCAISGKAQAELDQLTKEDFAELQATAALFPDELVESELGEVPRAWAIGELKDLIDFNPKRTLKKDSLALYLDMKNVPTQGHLVDEVIWRNMSSGTKFINGDTLLARITPCLENGKTAYVDFLSNNEVGWGSTEFIVLRPRDPLPVSLGYFLARQDNFRTLAIQSMTGTSGRQRANADNLANQLWLIYPKRLLIEFDKYSGKYLKKAKINGQQNRVLKSLRDTLLPKLLSGEMDMLLLRQEGA